MPEIRNKYGKTSGDPCGAFCTRFDLEAWNEQARAELARARASGIDVADLQAVPLQNPITLAPWQDLRSAIDASASVAQRALDRFVAKVDADKKPTPTPEPDNGGWTWPDWPGWPEGWKMPTLPTFGVPNWIWYALAGVAALVLLEGKKRK